MIAAFDAADPFSRRWEPVPPPPPTAGPGRGPAAGRRVGVPRREQWEFFGDDGFEKAYKEALGRLERTGRRPGRDRPRSRCGGRAAALRQRPRGRAAHRRRAVAGVTPRRCPPGGGRDPVGRGVLHRRRRPRRPPPPGGAPPPVRAGLGRRRPAGIPHHRHDVHGRGGAGRPHRLQRDPRPLHELRQPAGPLRRRRPGRGPARRRPLRPHRGGPGPPRPRRRPWPLSSPASTRGRPPLACAPRRAPPDPAP